MRACGRSIKENECFEVHAGSQVNLDRKIFKTVSAENARRSLFGERTGIMPLEDDLEFNSPSVAAVFVLGGSQNGWTEGINNNGNTLAPSTGKKWSK